jgi:hypothetical protein
MAKITELQKYARAKKAKQTKPAAKSNGKPAAARAVGAKNGGVRDIDHFIKTAGLDSQREK